MRLLTCETYPPCLNRRSLLSRAVPEFFISDNFTLTKHFYSFDPRFKPKNWLIMFSSFDKASKEVEVRKNVKTYTSPETEGNCPDSESLR